MLTLSVRVGQTVAVGGPAEITVEEKSGQVVKLAIKADRSIPIKLVDVTQPRGTSYGLGDKPRNKEA